MSIIRVGIICGSNRKPRAGDQITDFVLETIKLHLQTNGVQKIAKETFEFDYIDINTLSLPFYDEPGIPSKIYASEDYEHEHTRSWSRRVAKLNAFVFVTPQYNWGVPAALKNAIDFLFHEWTGKPAVIISYGGHGGDKAASALKLCLAGGIKMHIDDGMVVNLTFPDREVLYKAARGQQLGLEAGGDEGVWSSEKSLITDAWDYMIGKL